MPIDRQLIDPAPKVLGRVLRQAVRSANHRLDARHIDKADTYWDSFVRRAGARAEGWQRWLGGRGGFPAALVEAAWWTDPVGRKHWRLCGRKRQWAYTLVSPFQDHPIWHVYPDRLLLRERDGQRELLAACPCGVSGALERIAWMGECCGPCHDRREEGLPERTGPDWPPTLRRHSSFVSLLAFAGEQTLISAGFDSRIVRWNLGDGSHEDLWHRPHGSVHALAACSAGVVAASTRGNRVQVRGPHEADWRTVTIGCGQIHWLALSADGRWLAALGQRAVLVDLDGGGTRPMPIPAGRTVTGLAFGPDGRALWVLDSTGALSRVDVANPDAAAVVTESLFTSSRYPFHGGSVFTLAVSPRGQYSALPRWTTPPQLLFADLGDGRWSTVPGWSSEHVQALAFTSDELLATASTDGAVRLYDPRRRQWRGILHAAPQHHSGAYWCPTFSPSGDLLARSDIKGVVRVVPWRTILEGP